MEVLALHYKYVDNWVISLQNIQQEAAESICQAIGLITSRLLTRYIGAHRV